jgi:hypothetical protein
MFPSPGSAVRNARGLVRSVSKDGMTFEPEKTEEEKRLESSTISMQRELSPEEEQRVQFLKNLLAQILSLSDGQPTDEQKTRIKDIEKELEKITGVKMRSSLSAATEKIPAKSKKAQEEEEHSKLERQIRGIDPQEVVHRLQIAEPGSDQPGLGAQMLRRTGAAAYLTAMDADSLKGGASALSLSA